MMCENVLHKSWHKRFCCSFKSSKIILITKLKLCRIVDLDAYRDFRNTPLHSLAGAEDNFPDEAMLLGRVVCWDIQSWELFSRSLHVWLNVPGNTGCLTRTYRMSDVLAFQHIVLPTIHTAFLQSCMNTVPRHGLQGVVANPLSPMLKFKALLLWAIKDSFLW